MCDFDQSCTGHHSLDPRKRVNYELGMVLGEDEFRQEQWYLRARDHLGVRALHGYGTVAGLAVGLNAAGEIEVSPGLAVDPAGRFVCVPRAQCADLDEWVASHQDELSAAGVSGSTPHTASLWVVLCYRECPTDEVPVPSEDCRPAADSYVASRILDSFELRLELVPPEPSGEVKGTALQESIDRLLAAAESAPGPSADDAAVRDELRSWVTEDRPELGEAPCLGNDEACIVLARVDVDLQDGASGLVVDGAPTFDDTERPVLLSTRYLQEWLIALMGALDGTLQHGDAAGGDLNGTYPNPTVDGLQGRPLAPAAPASGDVLRFDGSVWRPGLAGVSGPAGGDLDGTYPNPTVDGIRGRPVANVAPAAGEILRYTGTEWRPGQPSPVGPAGGDLDGTYPNPTVDGLQGRAVANTAPAAGHVLTFRNNQWRPEAPPTADLSGVIRDGDPAGGDLDGTYPDPVVDGLQKTPVAPDPPDPGDVLVFDGEVWRPGKGGGGGGAARALLPFATINPIKVPQFQIWFHLEFPTNGVEVIHDPLVREEQFIVRSENERPPGFLLTRGSSDAGRTFRNVYDLDIELGGPALLRFIFFIDRIGVVDDTGQDMSIRDLARSRDLGFMGQDADQETVTVPVYVGPFRGDR